jgi:hypothetical protein
MPTRTLSAAFAVVAGVLAICSACTITRDVQLYPDNDAARALGPLNGSIVGHGNLNGAITLTMPNGEILNGRYSIGAGGGVGFGSLYSSVYGTGGAATGSATTSSMFMSGSGEGMADAVGAHGTTTHCEFMNNNFNGHGHGACRMSDGSIYRMQY